MLEEYLVSKDVDELLFNAVESNDIESAKYALEHSANINGNFNYFGKATPLLQAIKYGYYEIAKLLVEYGADINEADEFGTTPLFVAIENRNIEFAKYLLEKGAKTYYMGENFKCCALQYAISMTDMNFIKTLLLSTPINNLWGSDESSLLVLAIREGNKELVELLCEEGEDVNHYDGNFITPLMEAIEVLKINGSMGRTSVYLDIIKYLLNKGADPDYTFSDHHVITPLMRAASSFKLLPVVRLLLEYGADVNKLDDFGRDALKHAAYNGVFINIPLLLDFNADPYTKDEFGNTVLDIVKTQMENTDYESEKLEWKKIIDILDGRKNARNTNL
jgi:ankyrin repeat protein